MSDKRGRRKVKEEEREAIRYLIEETGHSARDVAERIGLSWGTVYSVMRGSRKRIDPATQGALQRAFSYAEKCKRAAKAREAKAGKPKPAPALNGNGAKVPRTFQDYIRGQVVSAEEERLEKIESKLDTIAQGMASLMEFFGVNQ